jgi:hypothetical protein
MLAVAASVRFFIRIAFLAVPFLALGVIAALVVDTLHWLFGIGKEIGDAPFMWVFAGIVISLLLSIATKTDALPGLFKEEKSNNKPLED